MTPIRRKRPSRRVQMGRWSVLWGSTTVWANVLLGVSLFLAIPELQEVGFNTRWIALGQAAVGIALRFIKTSEPLVERRPRR
jgi:hypothetical protein